MSRSRASLIGPAEVDRGEIVPEARIQPGRGGVLSESRRPQKGH